MNSRIKDAWVQRVKGFVDPHFATADSLLKPATVDTAVFGHHLSVSFERGTRVFCFSGQTNRDRFVNQYRGYDAKPCANPTE